MSSSVFSGQPRVEKGHMPEENHVVVAVIGGNAVPPPELTGDAPVLDVVHPVEIGLGVPFGHELDASVLHSLYGGLGKILYRNEPLL